MKFSSTVIVFVMHRISSEYDIESTDGYKLFLRIGNNIVS